MVAQAQMEQAHLDNMEQLRETINRQHQQDIEATKKHMENEMKEVWIYFISIKDVFLSIPNFWLS
jgi:hypothetical protein